MERLISLLGIAAMLAIAFGLSNNRKRINWRTVALGIGIQIVLGFLLLQNETTRNLFAWFTTKVEQFLALADTGGKVVFGSFADPGRFGFVLGLRIFVTVIFFSAFISVMYYLGVIQVLIVALARLMRWTMKTSGSETLSCSANIFIGMTEAPLVIKPYLEKMTRSELFAVMAGGFATIAGSVLAIYIDLVGSARHLIIASVMSAPAALVMAKIMFPETETSETAGAVALPKIDKGVNIIDAAVRGTTDGMRLALNVIAMLISFLALIAVVDWLLGGLDFLIDGHLLGGEAITVGGTTEYDGIFPGSLRTLFGFVFAPIAFLLGVSWGDVTEVGNLLGIKICANEMIAYTQLRGLIDAGAISERSVAIATYALCGFANFGSVGITIGGISAIAPGRREDLAKLALRAMIAGALASWTTAAVAGLML